MMKKLIKGALLGLAVVTFSSCVVTTHYVNSNPVGNKVGEASAKNIFDKDKDWSYQTAAKNGNIQKISTAEHKTFVLLFFMKQTTTLSGE